MSFSNTLDRIVDRAAELRSMLSESLGGEAFVKASKELAEIEPLVARIDELRANERGAAEARAMLGVAPDAGRTEIESAYRRLIRQAHPDHGGSSGAAARLNAARDRLLKRGYQAGP